MDMMLALMEPVLGVGPTYERITCMHRETTVTQEASGVESPRRSTEASLRKWHWSQDLKHGCEGQLKHGCEGQPGVI